MDSDKQIAQRFNKHYTTKFYLKDQPERFYDISRLLDISRTGLKFFSYDEHHVGSVIVFLIQFPYLYPKITAIEGEVVGTEAVLQGTTTKVRVKFINVSEEVQQDLAKMENFNTNL